MDKEQIMSKLTALFQELFEDDDIVLTEQTTAKDIDDWDSLAHLELISTVETEFKIRFTLGEINSFANVGEMCSCIMKHLEA